MLFPTLIFAAMLYYGIVWNVGIALTDYSILNPHPHFTGLKSFAELFSDPEFQAAFTRTLLWVALLVLAGNLVGLLIACSIFQFANSRALRLGMP